MTNPEYLSICLGVPLTRGQAQQLVSAGHVPDKVRWHSWHPTLRTPENTIPGNPFMHV